MKFLTYNPEQAYLLSPSVREVLGEDHIWAVKKILRGYRREETARFLAFRSHWRYASEFCTPAAAHEKGGVEGEVGYFRRNHWTPVPQAKDLEELNAQLVAACQHDQQRQISGHPLRVRAAMQVEREHLLPLAEEGFDLAEVSFPRVDGLGRVKVRTNFYSVPLQPGTCVQAKVYSSSVELWHEVQCRARHERCYGRATGGSGLGTLPGGVGAEAGCAGRRVKIGSGGSCRRGTVGRREHCGGSSCWRWANSTAMTGCVER